MLKRNNRIIIIVLLFIVSFIAIYAGHFLLEKTKVNEKNKKPEKLESSNKIDINNERPIPIVYKHLSRIVNGDVQEINILEIDTSDMRVKIRPALSYNSIFGFEKLKSISIRNNAYAAINAGFFHEYGNPVGLVMIDGKIISMSTGNYPVFMVKDGKPELKEYKPNLWLYHGNDKIKIDNMNTLVTRSGVVLYTKEYGSDNRAKSENYSVTISNNKVVSVRKYRGKVPIPKDGMVLTIYKPNKKEISNLPIVGEDVKLVYTPDLGNNTNAYECGSWIVRKGKIVLGKFDPWIGILTNHDPRTIIGIKSDGRVVMMTVDGRQPGYSIGFTGKELAEFILNYGITDAAMLDGGASTEMIVKNKIVNKPSDRGQERAVGGGMVIEFEVDN